MNRKITVIFLLLVLLLFSGCKVLNPQTESTTSADITSSVFMQTTTEPETIKWYLEMQTDRLIETMSVPAELSEYTVKVPLQYTETVDNIVFTFNFFQEYYPLGGLIQLRVTVTNNTGADIKFVGNNSPGYFSDNKQCLTITGITVYQAAYYAMTSVEMETIKAGETVIYERLYTASPDFFMPGKTIMYVYDSLGALYKIKIPVDVVKLS